MAVKAAAAASPMDTGAAVSSFYFHRLLCRVFSGGNDSFVLKGGQAMLARTVGARATRDIDLRPTETSLEAALEELVRLVRRPTWATSSRSSSRSRPIKAGDEYRDGISVRFVPILGARRMPPISIDLVVNEVTHEGAEPIAPADRIEVEGLVTCDYLVYPIEAALADKLCGIVERHGGRASSRVKDLVDVTVYAVTSEVDGGRLQSRLRREAAVRRIPPPDDTFRLPEAWGFPQARQFAKLCQMTGLPGSLKNIDAAGELAGMLFGPAIRGKAEGLRWNPSGLKWE